MQNIFFRATNWPPLAISDDIEIMKCIYNVAAVNRLSVVSAFIYSWTCICTNEY